MKTDKRINKPSCFNFDSANNGSGWDRFEVERDCFGVDFWVVLVGVAGRSDGSVGGGVFLGEGLVVSFSGCFPLFEEIFFDCIEYVRS